MRWRRVLDIALAVGVWLYLTGLILDAPDQRMTWPDAAALLTAPVQGAALAWRRSRPVAVLLVALAGGLVLQLVVPYGIFPLAALIALFSLAALRPPPVSLPALAGVLAVTAVVWRTEAGGDVLFAMAVAVLVWSLGEVARNRRVAIEQSSRRAVTEEKARIARELHDVIAHSVSVIVVQAAAADDVFDRHPEKAREALRSIEAAGREALGELRTLLAGVRPDSAPRPGVDRLAELASPLRAAGLAVSVTADAGELPPAVDLCAYRIVQEALTNTLRHAGATQAEVTVRATGGVLELNVRDDGRGGGIGTAGRGITGMRERAAMLGGTLEAGPLPGGGFRVHARLPVAASEAL
jgi:signal transduction histidine kinase